MTRRHLVENGVPAPAFSHNTLWRVLDVADTLDRDFNQIQYTQTALGHMAIEADRVTIDNQAQIASYRQDDMG